jgi:hypothetical protein
LPFPPREVTKCGAHMNAVDAELIRTIRREIGKRPIDTTRMELQVTNGKVILSGTIANTRDQPLIVLKDEMAFLERIFMRIPTLRELNVQLRYNQNDTKPEHEGDARGRLRH